MKITSDWHIHSTSGCDAIISGKGVTMSEIVAGAGGKGIVDFGATDHFHTPFNLPEIRGSREEYLACGPGPRFHFGVEVSCISEWELREIAAGRGPDNPVHGLREGGPAGRALAIGLTEKDVEELGIEYVIGGTHWPMYVPFEREALIHDYHRQNMFLATHPLVDIVAHPWWFHSMYWKTNKCPKGEPWFDDFGWIPKSMHQEFAAAAIEHDTAIEINVLAVLLKDESLYPARFKRRYLDYLSELQGRGVKLSIGSDCHDSYSLIDFDRAATMLDSAGIREKDLWALPPRVVFGKSDR